MSLTRMFSRFIGSIVLVFHMNHMVSNLVVSSCNTIKKKRQISKGSRPYENMVKRQYGLTSCNLHIPREEKNHQYYVNLIPKISFKETFSYILFLRLYIPCHIIVSACNWFSAFLVLYKPHFTTVFFSFVLFVSH